MLFRKNKKDIPTDYYTVPEAYDESERQSREWERSEDERHKDSPQTSPAAPRNRRRSIAVWTVVILAAVMGVAFWMRYMSPYVSDATERGYVMKVERRGFLFKTWEGELVLERDLADRSSLYQREFEFSVKDKAVVDSLIEYQGTGLPVRVTYRRYLGTLPWRGASTFVVTSVQPVGKSAVAHPGDE